jgi:hypothetical protein
MAFIFESVNRAINIAFIFVPALVGVDEIATGLLTGVLGLGAPRELLWRSFENCECSSGSVSGWVFSQGLMKN